VTVRKAVGKLRDAWRSYRSRPRIRRPHSDQHSGELIVGEGTCLGKRIEFDCTGTVEIGKHCIISDDVKILTQSHHFTEGWLPDITTEMGIRATGIKIGDNVYIGREAMILPQAGTIADHAMIGARSVVTKPVGTGEIWAGNPAQKVGGKQRPETLD
jgi:acetyltransferase-like isoleucine patch superfamily enzyme